MHSNIPLQIWRGFNVLIENKKPWGLAESSEGECVFRDVLCLLLNKDYVIWWYFCNVAVWYFVTWCKILVVSNLPLDKEHQQVHEIFK